MISKQITRVSLALVNFICNPTCSRNKMGHILTSYLTPTTILLIQEHVCFFWEIIHYCIHHSAHHIGAYFDLQAANPLPVSPELCLRASVRSSVCPKARRRRSARTRRDAAPSSPSVSRGLWVLT